MAKFILIHGFRIAKDFTPETFGRLTTLGPAFRIGKESWQVCKCQCDNMVVVRTGHVNSGGTTSCGCYHREVMVVRSTKHGLREHSLYKTWNSMIQRCCNSKHPYYADYGGRGITVCDRWRESFLNFLADMGERPENCSIDRIDNSRGYEPGNCRWATQKEQCNNQRRNRLLTYNDKTQTLAQWSRELNFPKNLICACLHRGWGVEEALTIPPGKKRS